MIPVIELKTELQKIDKDVEILSYRKSVTGAYDKTLYYAVYKPSTEYLVSFNRLELAKPVIISGNNYNLLALPIQKIIEMSLKDDPEVVFYLGSNTEFLQNGNAAYCIARARELGRCTKTFANYLIQTTYNIRELTIQDMLLALIEKQ